MLQTVTKTIGTPVWTAAGTQLAPFACDRTFPLTGLFIRIAGSLNTTVAASAIQAEAWRNFLANVLLVASDDNGAVNIVNATSRGIWRHEHFFFGTTPEYNDVTPLAVGVQRNDFTGTFPLPILIPGADPFPYTTILPSYRLNGLDLTITTGNVTDILAGGTTAFTAFGLVTGVPSLTVYEEIPVDINPDTLLTSLYRVTEKSFDVSTSNADLFTNTNLNVGTVMQGVVLYARGNNAGTLTARDTIITSDRFEAAGQVLLNMLWQPGQQRFKTLAALETLPAGYSALEFSKGGDIRKGIDTRGWADRGITYEHHINTAGNQGSDTSSTLFVMQRELVLRS